MHCARQASPRAIVVDDTDRIPDLRHLTVHQGIHIGREVVGRPQNKDSERDVEMTADEVAGVHGSNCRRPSESCQEM